MHIIKYLLWVLLISILSLLLVGLVKHNGNMVDYIRFLNNRQWSDVWNHGSISYMFWGEDGEQLITNSEQLSGDNLTGNLQLETGNQTGVDVFDPNFEKDLNQISDDDRDVSTSNNQSNDFGFVTDVTGILSDEVVTGDSKIQLLEMMKKKENQ